MRTSKQMSREKNTGGGSFGEKLTLKALSCVPLRRTRTLRRRRVNRGTSAWSPGLSLSFDPKQRFFRGCDGARRGQTISWTARARPAYKSLTESRLFGPHTSLGQRARRCVRILAPITCRPEAAEVSANRGCLLGSVRLDDRCEECVRRNSPRPGVRYHRSYDPGEAPRTV
jgi:hypothetical protein